MKLPDLREIGTDLDRVEAEIERANKHLLEVVSRNATTMQGRPLFFPQAVPPHVGQI